MADQTTFVSMSDGDVPKDGYFDQGFGAIPPIGAIVAWPKSTSVTPQILPAGWVECDGATLNDADSVYDGQVIPDLNGDNRFLRGNSTSGGTGGEDTVDFEHTHTIGTTRFNDVNANSAMTDVGPITGMTNPVDNKPPYHEMVWIMRIK